MPIRLSKSTACLWSAILTRKGFIVVSEKDNVFDQTLSEGQQKLAVFDTALEQGLTGPWSKLTR